MIHIFFLKKATWKLVSFVLFLDFIKITFFPSLDLIYWGAATITLDLISGIIKAVATGDFLISTGIRKTIIKLTQYIGVILLLIILANIFTIDPVGMKKSLEIFGKNNQMVYDKLIVSLRYINNLVLILIIYTEALSISENLVAIDPSSAFSKYFLRPLHHLLSLAVMSNAIRKAAQRLDQNNNTKTT
jgi:hypothetical protein